MTRDVTVGVPLEVYSWATFGAGFGGLWPECTDLAQSGIIPYWCPKVLQDLSPNWAVGANVFAWDFMSLGHAISGPKYQAEAYEGNAVSNSPMKLVMANNRPPNASAIYPTVASPIWPNTTYEIGLGGGSATDRDGDALWYQFRFGDPSGSFTKYPPDACNSDSPPDDGPCDGVK